MKENVEYIKEEMSTQESFLESFLKLERFYKKYKKAIFSIATIAVIGFAGNSFMNYTQEQNKLEANELFNSYLENPSDKKILVSLEAKDLKLYNLALYMENKADNINTEFLKELREYSKAIEANDITKIDAVTQKQKFVLKEFAIYNKALIQTQNGKYADAKSSLGQISVTSNINPLVKMLEHYLLTK